MERSQMVNEKGLSVVLGSYNRKRFLKHTLRNIRNELVNFNVPHEIIIVDGGSTDGTEKT
jgi:glycosyltransferase involved in cell wall biosynthesis